MSALEKRQLVKPSSASASPPFPPPLAFCSSDTLVLRVLHPLSSLSRYMWKKVLQLYGSSPAFGQRAHPRTSPSYSLALRQLFPPEAYMLLHTSFSPRRLLVAFYYLPSFPSGS